MASLCGLARLTSFVLHSVMTGFLLGIAVLMVLGQLGRFLGYEPEGSNQVSKTFDLLQNIGRIDVATTAIGCLTPAIILLVPRAGLKAFGPILHHAGSGIRGVQVDRVAGIEGFSQIGSTH